MKRIALIAVVAVVIGCVGETTQAQFGISIPKPSFPNINGGSIDPRRQLQRELENARRRVREYQRIDSNRAAVQANISRGWYVAWGKHIDHAEYQKFVAALAASVVSANPGPVQLYLHHMLYQMKVEISRSLRGQARQVLVDFEMRVIRALHQAISTGRPVQLWFGGVRVEIGNATYNHWKTVSGNYPHISNWKIVWRHAERTIALPNTHQPYVRFRVNYGF